MVIAMWRARAVMTQVSTGHPRAVRLVSAAIAIHTMRRLGAIVPNAMAPSAGQVYRAPSDSRPTQRLRSLCCVAHTARSIATAATIQARRLSNAFARCNSRNAAAATKTCTMASLLHVTRENVARVTMNAHLLPQISALPRMRPRAFRWLVDTRR